MERWVESQLENFVAGRYRSDEVVHWQDFMADVRATDLPNEVKLAAEQLPPGEYSKQQLLHTIEGTKTYLHSGGPER